MLSYFQFLLILLVCWPVSPFPATNTTSSSSSSPNSTLLRTQTEVNHPGFNINGLSPEEDQRPSHFEILSLNWHHIETPYTVSLWILLASVAKILFHVHKEFGEAIPDSALLIVVGLVLGYGLKQLHVSYELFTLKSTTFFLYLLPPIIFDAGYFMPNRQLFENLDSVMLFAFVGTIWNTVAIGLTLFLLAQFQLFSVSFSHFEILLFASLISAVDPVAVIAVFEEIHVNEFLFINVFGEALFNDGVSVVLYQMFRKFTLIGVDHLVLTDYAAGIASFLVIALGGILIGLLFALLVSLLTKFTSRVKILAPVFVFVVPYLAYLTAEMFGLSAILAIVACGIAMKQYVKGNLTHDANSSVKYFVKMLAQCSETAIFMFLGLSTIASKHHWDVAFVGITVLLCLVYRIIGVLVQCAVLNRFRAKKFSYRDQFVLSYGGLRGAIAFGLVVSLPASIAAKQMFVTTCIAVIYFTVFLQGITIRPLLYLLKVEKQVLDIEDLMVEKVYNKYFDYTMAGIEDIVGQRGRHFVRDTFERFNAKVLKPLLMRNVTRKTFDASVIVRAYKKITLQEAMKIAQIGRKMQKASVEEEKWSPPQSIASAFRETTLQNGGDRARGTTPAKQDISRLLANEESMDALYTMFSRLLDRKVEQLKVVQGQAAAKKTQKEAEDDIKDNYMDTFLHSASSQQAQPHAGNNLTLRRPMTGASTHSQNATIELSSQQQPTTITTTDAAADGDGIKRHTSQPIFVVHKSSDSFERPSAEYKKEEEMGRSEENNNDNKNDDDKEVGKCTSANID